MDDLNNFNRQLIEEYRANGRVVTGPFAGGPILLLTTTGAKSGQQRTNPLAYTRDGDRLVVIASKGGAPTNPDWFRNLVAHPEATVELRGERFPVRASFPQEEERQRLYDQMAAKMPNFAEYQRKTTRQIPVVVLQRQG
jgi:deazaflavin-dependent oxidoreductase (nitroreductase family)